MKSVACLLLVGLLGACASARGAEAPAVVGPVCLLDLEHGSFRAYMGWRTPMLIGADGRPQPLREPRRPDLKEEDRLPVPVRASAAPAENWAAPDFDDSGWARMRGAAIVRQNGLAWDRVYVRGAFRVDDPARVRALRLEVRYHGGVRIRVNGVEWTRAHLLPPGAARPEPWAEPYPEEAYLRPDGKLYGLKDTQDKALAERMQARVRKLPATGAGGLELPVGLLHKGINILAIECFAAPVNRLAFEAPSADTAAERENWPHAGLIAARLDAAAPDGLTVQSGPAIRIGNVAPAATLSVWDDVRPGAVLRPVRLTGAANGVFSGRVVLSADAPLRGLKGSAAELTQAGGLMKIPASAIQIRWAEVAAPDKGWARANGFDRLLAEPPAEVALSPAGPAGTAPVAVVPVWITLRVPNDASPGDYTGAVTLAAQAGTGEPASFQVPLQVRIHAWKLPDARDFTFIANMLQSDDSVARFYRVPMWSDRHFELIGKSLDVLQQVGSRICNLNLIVGMHGYGNSESMVRWVRKDDGAFDYDFTVAEKYMDLFEKTCGKPRMLQVNAWAFPGDNPAQPKWPPESVTVVDPNGKWIENRLQPPYGTPENEAFWRPVLSGLRQRLEKRGWFDVTRIGWLAYQSGPDKGIVNVARAIWPDGRWIKNSHQASKEFFGMPVVCNSAVWGVGALYDPDCETRWRQRPVYAANGRRAYPRPWTSGDDQVLLGIPRWGAAFVRPGLYAQSSLMRYRSIAERTLQGNIRGLGQVGGDFWPVPIDARGRLGTICTGQGAVTPRVNTLAMCSPGPDGAIFNERLEMFREGIQIYEAMVFLQRALADKRVGDELARRIEELLDERARVQLHNENPLPVGPGSDPGHWMTRECTDWQREDDRLFALAGEVALRPGR